MVDLLRFISPEYPYTQSCADRNTAKMAKEETELQRVDSYQYPAAHLGHLTANQQTALDKFKDLCKDAGYYRPAGVDGKKIASHDDETML